MVKTLILGASYGSLFGTKLLLAGHGVALVVHRDDDRQRLRLAK